MSDFDQYSRRPQKKLAWRAWLSWPGVDQRPGRAPRRATPPGSSRPRQRIATPTAQPTVFVTTTVTPLSGLSGGQHWGPSTSSPSFGNTAVATARNSAQTASGSQTATRHPSAPRSVHQAEITQSGTSYGYYFNGDITAGNNERYVAGGSTPTYSACTTARYSSKARLLKKGTAFTPSRHRAGWQASRSLRSATRRITWY